MSNWENMFSADMKQDISTKGIIKGSPHVAAVEENTIQKYISTKFGIELQDISGYDIIIRKNEE